MANRTQSLYAQFGAIVDTSSTSMDDPLPLLGILDSSQTGLSALGTASQSRHRQQTTMCLLMHTILILVHVALLIVWSDHYERNLVFPFNAFLSDWLPTIITTISQTIGVLYLALLVLITQQIATRIELYSVQTLTSLHDKTNAWLGLGSAAISLWQQTKVCAAPYGVACVTVYLIAIFALHVTIPTIFNIQPYNATVRTTQKTKLANIDFIYGMPDPFDILASSGQFQTTPGLLDNVVYDVIPLVPGAVGNVTVNASIWNVECSDVPEMWFQPISEATMSYPVRFKNWTSMDVNTPAYPALWSINNWEFFMSNGEFETESLSPGVVLLSTIPITDSDGAASSDSPWKPIDPPLLYNTTNNKADKRKIAPVTGLQAIACSIKISDALLNVSAETALPFWSQGPRFVTWPNSTRFPDSPQIPSDHRVNKTLTALQSLSGSQPWTLVTLGIPSNKRNISRITPSAPQAVSDKIVVELSPYWGLYRSALSTFDLFLLGDIRSRYSDSPTSLSLADIEHSVGKALATVYWYGRNYNYTSPVGYAIANLEGQTINYDSVAEGQGEAVIMVSSLGLRLNLSLGPLIAGLVASTALFFLCVALIRPFASYKHLPCMAFDNPGILQLTWLLGGDRHMNDLLVPRGTRLRRAGMFDVQISEMAGKRLDSLIDDVNEKGRLDQSSQRDRNDDEKVNEFERSYRE